MRAALVVRLDHVPRSLLDVGVGEHLVLGFRVVHPPCPGLEVHGAELPALAGILDASLETALLLLVTHREPVLDEDDAGGDQHPLDLGTAAHELVVLGLGTEAHHVLDPGPVVPASVEEDHLSGGREMGNVALEIPLCPLPLGGRRQGYHPGEAGVQKTRDPLDHAALAGRVAAFEEHHQPELFVSNPFLELEEFDLKARQLLVVVLAGKLPGLPLRS